MLSNDQIYIRVRLSRRLDFGVQTASHRNTAYQGAYADTCAVSYLISIISLSTTVLSKLPIIVAVAVRYSVVVSTPDFETESKISGNPGSNPGTANYTANYFVGAPYLFWSAPKGEANVVWILISYTLILNSTVHMQNLSCNQ